MSQVATGNARWLGAALAVLGLFLMHGLTADHEMPMAMTAAADTTHAAGHITSATLHSSAADSTMTGVSAAGRYAVDYADQSRVHGVIATAATVTATTSLFPTVPGHGHGMGGTCLALLSTVVLLPLLLRRLARSRERERTVNAASLFSVVARTPPDWLPVLALNRLCISRT